MPQDKSTTIPITSPPDYPLAPTEQKRVSDFINSINVKNKPSSIVVVDPQKFTSIAKTMAGGPTRTAFTIGDRIYLNGAALHSSNTSGMASDLGHSGQNVQLAELALSHELAHMQDSRPRPWQEAHDSIYNAEGQKIFENWQASIAQQQKNSAAAYQSLKEQSNVRVPQEIQGLIPNTSGQDMTIRPTPAPIQTQLVAPNVRTLTAPPDRVASIMSQKPQSTYVQSVMASSPNKGK